MNQTNNQAPTRPSHRKLPLPGVEQLWVLLVLTVIGAFIALVPTPPHDFWWHLKAGQIVATQGIPTTNLFAWSLPADTPYIYATWLGEWLFYALYSIGGLQADVLARNLLGVAGFSLVAIEARRRSGSWRLAAAATLLAGAMTMNNLATRTQNWSWVPFGLFVLIIGAYTAGQLQPRALLALPAIMMFWVNVHGAFVLGLVLMVIAVAGETLRLLLRHAGAPSRDRLRWLYLATAATFIATLVNPIGLGIFGYVLKLLTDPSSQNLIVEWQPPTPRNLAGMFFFASIVLLLAALAFRQRRPSITDMLLVCAFLWLAVSGQRYVMWYGMLAMPLLAESAAAIRPTRPRLSTRPRLQLPSTVVALVLLALLIVVQPPFKHLIDWPAEYKEGFVDLPGAPELFNTETPVAATEYLRAHPIDGRLFNDLGYGSYLDWALYPATQVFADPRIELYPPIIWQDYQAITNARNYNSLLIDKYHVQRVLLDRDAQQHLAEALATDPLWQREYADARAEIYLRK